jgi:hypothetical protein
LSRTCSRKWLRQSPASTELSRRHHKSTLRQPWVLIEGGRMRMYPEPPRCWSWHHYPL